MKKKLQAIKEVSIRSLSSRKLKDTVPKMNLKVHEVKHLWKVIIAEERASKQKKNQFYLLVRLLPL